MASPSASERMWRKWKDSNDKQINCYQIQWVHLFFILPLLPSPLSRVDQMINYITQLTALFTFCHHLVIQLMTKAQFTDGHGPPGDHRWVTGAELFKWWATTMMPLTDVTCSLANQYLVTFYLASCVQLNLIPPSDLIFVSPKFDLWLCFWSLVSFFLLTSLWNSCSFLSLSFHPVYSKSPAYPGPLIHLANC